MSAVEHGSRSNGQDIWGVAMREALRSFWRSPLVAALAVVTLALGLGVATAVFGVVDVLLIRSLPYPNSERLVEVWRERVPGGTTTVLRGAEIVRALREEARLFSAVESYRPEGATITGADEPEHVAAARISPGLLHLLGVAPRRGRLFYDEDALPGVRVALISERLWLRVRGRRFGCGRPHFDSGRTAHDRRSVAWGFRVPVTKSGHVAAFGHRSHAAPS